MTPLAIGQVRADPDPRAKGRTVTVISLDGIRYAEVHSNRGKMSRILATTLERWPLVSAEPTP
jgi:hypothetical protein